MKILKANPSDAEMIAPLFDQYRQFYQQPSNLELAQQFLSERLGNGESVIFYARVEKEALGFVQLYPSFSSVAMKRLWILNDLFVSPLARRRSLGRQLLERAAEYSLETKARGLTLKTAIDNLSAQQLYDSVGWKRDQRFYCYDLRTDLS